TGWKGFGAVGFGTFFKNSIIVSSLATLGVLISSSMAAYSFARLNYPGKTLWFACMMSTLMLPAQVLIIPQYIIFHRLNWLNTFLPLIVPSFFTNAFFVFLIMQFIQSLPVELDEAAIIDGCSKYSVFFRITLPMISPALITTIVINFYWKWDEFMQPLLYLSRPEMFTASIAIKAFADASSTTNYGSMFAMATLSLIPIFLIFLFFNRHLVEGISTSGLKA
ncbi:MAG: carbohydrate ABC transporter permease, partial [Clostridiales bacterium]|nr:carbohydrate ABC transporter permease [Clostridiales bacterium]